MVDPEIGHRSIAHQHVVHRTGDGDVQGHGKLVEEKIRRKPAF